MYEIAQYGMMVADRVRTGAYLEALRRTITPGMTVVDLGCGTGIFALLACRFGAERVWAIEPSSAIQVARELAAANGYTDHITFLQARSTAVTLPDRADLIVFDLRGILPLYGTALTDLVDARQRMLAPGGILIPRRDVLYAALVEAGEKHRPIAADLQDRPWDLVMDPVIPYTTSSWYKAVLGAEHLLTDPQRWAELDYRSLTSPHLEGNIRWPVRKPGTAHGMLLWFDADLTDEVGFSCRPGGEETVYGQTFFPFPEPLPLEAGAIVECSLSARLVGSAYIWRWRTGLRPTGEEGDLTVTFDQSSFHSVPVTRERLARRSEAAVPDLDRDGRIDRDILVLIDGTRTLGEIADEIRRRYPEAFPTRSFALERVAALAGHGP